MVSWRIEPRYPSRVICRSRIRGVRYARDTPSNSILLQAEIGSWWMSRSIMTERRRNVMKLMCFLFSRFGLE